jgi:metal-responsive CopG/Arc/MetJ family transcriptional regulator
MRSKRIQIKLSDEMLERIDEAAKAHFTSRSGYIREAVGLRLRREHVVPDPTPEDVIELLRRPGSV